MNLLGKRLISLPDELFSNEFPRSIAILDVFDRYNFTVNESDPLDQEIAVDPEMLGKVFENLLEKRSISFLYSQGNCSK